jgi:hypothetical protein
LFIAPPKKNTLLYVAVASADYKTRVCCLLALGQFSLGVFKNALHTLHFTIVSKRGVSYLSTENNNIHKQQISVFHAKF